MNIDWQRVLLNLRGAGVPVAQVAREVGMDDQTLRNVARGEVHKVNWLAAVQLLDLHFDHCPEKHRLEELRT